MAYRKIYITGSAYGLWVNNRLSEGRVTGRIRVYGSKSSSSVDGYVYLYRNGKRISSQAISPIGPKTTRGFQFHNVRNEGRLMVKFKLRKLGGSRGTYNGNMYVN